MSESPERIVTIFGGPNVLSKILNTVRQDVPVLCLLKQGLRSVPVVILA